MLPSDQVLRLETIYERYFIKYIAFCRYINKKEIITITNTLKRSLDVSDPVDFLLVAKELVTYSWIAVCIILASMSSGSSESSSLLYSYILTVATSIRLADMHNLRPALEVNVMFSDVPAIQYPFLNHRNYNPFMIDH